jgi:hypothetical protein
MLKIIKNFKGLNILLQNNYLKTNSIILNHNNLHKFQFGNYRRYFCESNKPEQKLNTDKNKNIEIEIEKQKQKEESSIKNNEKVNEMEFDVKLDSISSSEKLKSEYNNDKDHKQENENEKKEEIIDEIEKLKKIYREFYNSNMKFSEYKKIKKEYENKIHEEFRVK